MSKSLPAVYTVDRLKVLYKVFLNQFGFMELNILAFLNWLEARGDKIEDNPLDKRV